MGAAAQLLRIAPALARIDEDRCIGCLKCVQACPVDAIIGAAGLLHAVIPPYCIGCELCIAPCPVDCIAMEPAPVTGRDIEKARGRFLSRGARLLAAKQSTSGPQDEAATREQRRDYVRAAVERVRRKREAGTI
jgi:electron transport complex protein RnfB